MATHTTAQKTGLFVTTMAHAIARVEGRSTPIAQGRYVPTSPPRMALAFSPCRLVSLKLTGAKESRQRETGRLPRVGEATADRKGSPPSSQATATALTFRASCSGHSSPEATPTSLPELAALTETVSPQPQPFQALLAVSAKTILRLTRSSAQAVRISRRPCLVAQAQG